MPGTAYSSFSSQMVCFLERLPPRLDHGVGAPTRESALLVFYLKSPKPTRESLLQKILTFLGQEYRHAIVSCFAVYLIDTTSTHASEPLATLRFLPCGSTLSHPASVYFAAGLPVLWENSCALEMSNASGSGLSCRFDRYPPPHLSHAPGSLR